MDDRALLEAAARAAGFWADGYRPVERDGEGWICIRPADDNCMFQSVWAPLTDDGDALRLAVRLRLNLTIGDNFTAASSERNGVIEQSADPYAATRRCIVRAAAAMAPAPQEPAPNPTAQAPAHPPA